MKKRVSPAVRGKSPLTRRAAPASRVRLAPQVAPIPAPARDLEGKRQTLKKWWEAQNLPGKIQAWTPSPEVEFADDYNLLPQGHGKNWSLASLPDHRTLPPLAQSIGDYLSREHMHSLRSGISQIWIRRSLGQGWAVIFHGRIKNASAGHALKLFAQYLRNLQSEVESFHVVTTRDFRPIDLQAPPRTANLQLRTIFGSRFLHTTEDGHLAHVLDILPPFRQAWAQVPKRLAQTLRFKPGDHLLDLFCGSGHLGCNLAPHCASTVMLDARGLAKETVLANLHRKGSPKNVNFISASLDEDWVERFFRTTPPGNPWTALLDPNPGEALPPGFIPALCRREPARVVQVFHECSLVPPELRKWRRHGYMVRKVLPFDTFPGEIGFSIAVVLVPDRDGLLGQKPSGQPAKIKNKIADTGQPRFVQTKIPGASPEKKESSSKATAQNYRKRPSRV